MGHGALKNLVHDNDETKHVLVCKRIRVGLADHQRCLEKVHGRRFATILRVEENARDLWWLCENRSSRRRVW